MLTATLNQMPSHNQNTISSQRPIPSCLNSKLRISKPTNRADCAAIPPHAITKAISRINLDIHSISDHNADHKPLHHCLDQKRAATRSRPHSQRRRICRVRKGVYDCRPCSTHWSSKSTVCPKRPLGLVHCCQMSQINQK